MGVSITVYRQSLRHWQSRGNAGLRKGGGTVAGSAFARHCRERRYPGYWSSRTLAAPRAQHLSLINFSVSCSITSWPK